MLQSSSAKVAPRRSADQNSPTTQVNNFPDDPSFQELVRRVEKGISLGVAPVRIPGGSSGCYFVRDGEENVVGVFKPRDEEPYGELNPNFLKKLHKRCFPCFFGRDCLAPNQGYLCEAAAWVVSERLDLGIVPKTRVVRLASAEFNYESADFETPPPKVGSLQAYAEGFEEGDFWTEDFGRRKISEEVRREFQFEFEKMIVLDYVIRNTDRGKRNWLVKVETGEADGDFLSKSTRVHLVAIDNGLSFPHKHPDRVRMYPFEWSRLPEAKVPLSDEIKELVLDKLSSDAFVDSLAEELYGIFSRDESFSLEMFEGQMGVMRGQVSNLCEALREGMSGWELAGMEPVTLVKEGSFSVQSVSRKLQRKYRKKRPLLTWC